MQHDQPLPLKVGDKLEHKNNWNSTSFKVLKVDAKFAYLENNTRLSQVPCDAKKRIYKEYWTREKSRENKWNFPAEYRLITPEYEAEKAAALTEKVERIKAKINEGVSEKEALQIIKILFPQ